MVVRSIRTPSVVHLGIPSFEARERGRELGGLVAEQDDEEREERDDDRG